MLGFCFLAYIFQVKAWYPCCLSMARRLVKKRLQEAHNLVKSKCVSRVATELRTATISVMELMNMSTLPCALRASMEVSGCGRVTKFDKEIVALTLESVLHDQTGMYTLSMIMNTNSNMLLKAL